MLKTFTDQEVRVAGRALFFYCRGGSEHWSSAPERHRKFYECMAAEVLRAVEEDRDAETAAKAAMSGTR